MELIIIHFSASYVCFLTLKLHPSFLLTTVNHKSCTLSHNFSCNRKIYLIKKLLLKFCFKTRFYAQTLVKWSWHSNVSPTQKVSRILSHSLKSHREPPPDQQKLFFFLILIFNQYAPPNVFISDGCNFNT